ncbi:N-acetylmuramic acid 6-phosphate etherase [Microbacterium sp. zg.Y625]|uniref:N-acetylmuramic acid 6-phosphate etherase n=1 Tax=Microbacterium jiangjiandongii TaxID=3049071 RepID=UPI00214CCA4D|nr:MULTISPECIES: N-acetylmuramic acid 6-phosphate etherase [unclassified Microbacterium]MCR2793446.1 N-acetylmuramic acid 6-phosphate etherase [Microbacterium sp. zg.Y625]MCR2815376.1 N-acetylmuramic acid 6-phosphate etherase [Microbacterium sp. zg.Y843]WIM25183.1 N-acetylmuramic acid 6-phosphate etherase [Microbacterium sp. zg-Y625]
MTDVDALGRELSGLVTEGVDPQFAALDLMSTPELVAAMISHTRDVTAALDVAADAIGRAVDLAAERMARGGRLLYVGAGTPGRLGILDASEIPPTFGEPADRVVGIIAGGPAAVTTAVENAEDDAPAGAADLEAAAVGPDDCVIGVSASGRTPYVVGALGRARERGAATVGVSCNAGSPVGAASDIAIDVVVGPELIAGSTRLKAGTAQKIVLNTVSTLVMVRLGKTYGNRMVDVRATNAKLRARALRTVMTVADVPAGDARRALDATAWAAKPAILICMTGTTAEAAQAALAAAGGSLRTALREMTEVS